ncbi:MAG: hypothetical protein DHS20C18_46300 [Saprospiraceae bacterium]|nr:MAG: hypothetical protein DHS20C18_46300 [Saprospiraceae bacterium]
MSEMTICQPAAETREKLFTDLYLEAFPLTANYISRMGGTLEEAKDIFQDALVVYYEKVVAGKIVLEKDEKAYLLGIAKYLWIRKYQTAKDQFFLGDDFPESADQPIPGPSSEKLLRFLEVAGQKCLELLKSFYYDHKPMKEITRILGYSSTRSTTVQKYKCLEKVRNEIKEKSMSYEDFLA